MGGITWGNGKEEGRETRTPLQLLMDLREGHKRQEKGTALVMEWVPGRGDQQ